MILPEIPYIGGKKNGLTFNLVGSAFILALIRFLEGLDFTSREIGKICYKISEHYYNSSPKILKYLTRRLMNSKYAIKKAKKKSAILQLKKYPENWVSEFIEGDGIDFDLGINYTECGICKFYQKQRAEKYLPYLCLLDYATFRAFGIGMKRTKTLGNGSDMCNFRFSKKFKTPQGWPPDDLEEFNLIKTN